MAALDHGALLGGLKRTKHPILSIAMSCLEVRIRTVLGKKSVFFWLLRRGLPKDVIYIIWEHLETSVNALIISTYT